MIVTSLFNVQDKGVSRTYPGNTGCEAAINSVWDASPSPFSMITHRFTYSFISRGN